MIPPQPQINLKESEAIMAIYVLELDNYGTINAWSCCNENDFCATADEALYRPGRCIDQGVYDDWTLATWYAECADEKECPTIADFAERLELPRETSPETKVYSADYLLGPGVYTLKDPGKLEAYEAALFRDTQESNVIKTDEDALGWLEFYEKQDDIFAPYLRELLVCEGVIEEEEEEESDD